MVTRHNVDQLDEFAALASRYGATLRITRLRPSGRGADVWEDLHPTADQQVQLYDWLVAKGDGVLTGDSFFHLAPLGQSGALAGLAGASETVGLQGRFYNVSPGYGFTSIAVGLVGRNHPIGVIAAGLLFGVLRAGATEMQNTAGVSKEIVQVLQGLVILAVAASAYVSMMRQRRNAARAATSTPTVPAGASS